MSLGIYKMRFGKDQQELLTPKFQVSKQVAGASVVNLGRAVQNDPLTRHPLMDPKKTQAQMAKVCASEMDYILGQHNRLPSHALMSCPSETLVKYVCPRV